MSALKPVSFRKPREHQPRLSKPYVPGRHSNRFWTEEEDAILIANYASGGVSACMAKLPAHRMSRSGIYVRAHKLGLAKEGQSRPTAVKVPDDFDDTLRAQWAQIDAKKRGEVALLADRLGVPRWWITKRATKLGLTTVHKKQPPWTAAEDELMRKAPLHKPDAAAKMFREHGFNRSPTAIMVRAKRLDLSRRAAREELSATRAAAILGIDNKGITAECINGRLPAVKREDNRLAQQGGSAWDIKPADLRQYVIDNIERIDLRKVDKIAFVDLLVNGGAQA